MSISNLLSQNVAFGEQPWTNIVCNSIETAYFKMPTSAGAGKQLTSDAAGNGTWVTNSSVLSIVPIGNTPNANGMTKTGTQLRLEPASTLFGGVLTTGTQSLSGNKTLQGDLSATNLTLTDPGVVASSLLRTDAGNKLVSGNVDLASSDVTGVLAIANGGTNSSTALTNGKMMVSAGGKIVEGGSPSLSIEFFDAFALMPGDNAGTVAVGSAVEFPQDGITNGTLITRFSATQIKVTGAGKWEVTWQVSVDEPGQLAVALAGIIQPNSVVGRATGTNQIYGIYVFETFGDEYVSIINPAGNPAALTITPIAGGTHSVSAHMLVKKLA